MSITNKLNLLSALASGVQNFLIIAVANAWMNGPYGLHSLLLEARFGLSAAVNASGAGGNSI